MKKLKSLSLLVLFILFSSSAFSETEFQKEIHERGAKVASDLISSISQEESSDEDVLISDGSVSFMLPSFWIASKPNQEVNGAKLVYYLQCDDYGANIIIQEMNLQLDDSISEKEMLMALVSMMTRIYEDLEIFETDADNRVYYTAKYSGANVIQDIIMYYGENKIYVLVATTRPDDYLDYLEDINMVFKTFKINE